jgi:hypothetical protein
MTFGPTGPTPRWLPAAPRVFGGTVTFDDIVRNLDRHGWMIVPQTGENIRQLAAEAGPRWRMRAWYPFNPWWADQPKRPFEVIEGGGQAGEPSPPREPFKLIPGGKDGGDGPSAA